MGLTSTENGFWESSDRHYTQREADTVRRQRSRELDKNETARYRGAIKDLGKQAQEVRAKRVEQRKEAKGICQTNLTNTKETNKDKRPHRRRAETAKVRAECDFVVANIEEDTAQKLEKIEGEREKEDGYRRSSRIARGHNRQREAERKKRTSPRERKEDVLDEIRNGLEPEMLPYFEEIKDSPGFKKLLAGGRMTGIEVVMQMAHDAPEDVFAALEREVERELRREIERFENEGGRLGAKGESSATVLDDTSDAIDAQRSEEPSIDEQSSEGAPVRKRGRPRGSKNANRETETASGATKSPTRRKRTTKANDARAQSSESDDHAREVERFEHEGGRVDETPQEEGDPHPSPEPHHHASSHPTSSRHEAHHESSHHSTSSSEPHMSREPHSGSHAHGSSAPASSDASSCACKVRGAHSHASSHDAHRSHTADAESGRAHHAAPAKEHHGEPTRPEDEPHDAKPHRRLSAAERTRWMPGTQPAQAPREEPSRPVRRDLFGEEEDTLPETPDAKEKSERPQPKRTDPEVQQAFGTDFSSWLAQAGPQLSLDSAPVKRASTSAASAIVVHHHEPTPRHEDRAVDKREAPITIQRKPLPDERIYIGKETHDHRGAAEHPARLETTSASTRTEPSTHAELPRHVEPTIIASATPTETAAPAERPKLITRGFTGGTLYVDHEKRLVQVAFEEMPEHIIRTVLRQRGFRWLSGLQRWHAPLEDATLQTAQTALTEHANHVEARLARRNGRKPASAPTSMIPPEYASAEAEIADAAPTNNTTDPSGAEPIDEESTDTDPTDGEPELNAYERKKAARAERLHARADALRAEANATYTSAKKKADIIPFGQPIHVGHHSERRDRNFRGRIDAQMRKSFELQAKAEEAERRAKRAENSDIISSDDPDAIKKLEAKIASIERKIDIADSINEAIRSARVGRKSNWELIAQHKLVALGIPQDEAVRFTKKDFAGRIGVPGYVKRNAQGEITRLNQRIRELKRRDARPVVEPVRIGEAVVTENREENRVQIRFDGIPPKEARSRLRGRGFVWAPSSGVWQRKLNDNATWTAKQVLRDIYGPNAEQKPATAAEPEPMRDPGDDTGEDDAPSSDGERSTDNGSDEPTPF